MRFIPAALIFVVGCTGYGVRVRSLPADAGFRLLSRSAPLQRGRVAADCGPEALCAVLQFYGKAADVDVITSRIYNPEIKGTVPVSLSVEAREAGVFAQSARGSLSLLRRAVDRDAPTIVMVEVRPKIFHFFVIVGYNDQTGQVVAEDYDGGKILVSYEELEKGWEPGRHYCLEVLEAKDADTRTGKGYERRGDYRRAIDFYRRALEKDPLDAEALTGLGLCLNATGDRKGARAAYEKALEQSPDDPQLLNNLADLYVTIGARIEEAERLAGLAVAGLEKRQKDLQTELAAAHEMYRRQIKQEIQETGMDLAGAFGTLGQARAANGRHEMAIAAWKASLDLMPLDEFDRRARRLLEIGTSYGQLGMPAEARKQFTRALEIAKDPALRAGIEARLK